MSESEFSQVSRSLETREPSGVESITNTVKNLVNLKVDGEVTTIGPKDIQYPLEDLEQWCNIGIYEYRYRAETEKTLKYGVANVRLPLPLQLQTQYQQQWNSFDDISSLAIGSYRSGAGLEENLKNAALTQEAFGLAGAALGSAAGLVGLKSSLGALLGAVGTSSIQQGVTALAGVSANKFETVTYQKPELRQHQFSWNLTAKSREEGIAIKNIIDKFKYHSHPGGKEGSYFKYPENFVIKFFSDENLFTIGPSILENFSVDYHAAGRPLYQASDRMPINLQISCSFKETAALTKNSIEKEGR